MKIRIGDIIKVRVPGQRVWMEVHGAEDWGVYGVLRNQIADADGLRWGDKIAVPWENVLELE